MKNSISENLELYEVNVVYKRPIYGSRPKINCSQQAYKLILELVDPNTIDYKEHFWVLLLTNGNSVLGFSEIGKGNTRSVAVNVKEIFQLCLKLNASGVILCHNHPSGTLKKSGIDQRFTDEVQRFARVLDISLLDHIIITSEDYYSFADSGDILVPDNTLPF